MKVQRHTDRFERSGGAVLFVVHDEVHTVRNTLLRDVGPVPFPILVDRNRHTYAAWGLGRAPWWRVWLDPKVLVQYATLLRSGSRLRGAGRDMLQLGGDFVVAPDGTVAYSRPQRRDDRPPAGQLLTIIDEFV